MANDENSNNAGVGYSVPPPNRSSAKPQSMARWKRRTTLATLCFINLINYIDRYSIASILNEIQAYYSITDFWGGFIQTAFMISYMFACPIAGYFGDRFNRKWQLLIGVIVWKLAVIGSSFVPPDMFWLFLTMRSLVGVGEACYSVITPTIISDMYTGNARSRAMMYFYIMISLGSGLGFALGQQLSIWLNGWAWSVRSIGLTGIICLFMNIFLVFEPERGLAEREREIKESEEREENPEKRTAWAEPPSDVLARTKAAKVTTPSGNTVSPAPVMSNINGGKLKATSYKDDMTYLLNNRSFLITTVAATLANFMVGNLGWFGPNMLKFAVAHERNLNSTDKLENVAGNLTTTFGVIVIVCGLGGTIVSTLLSNAMTSGWRCFRCVQTRRALTLVCGFSYLIATPCLAAVLFLSSKDVYATIAFIVPTIFFTSANFSLSTVILMSFIMPSRRATANSWQTTILHLFGDSGGPSLLGWISDTIRNNENTPTARLHSLVYTFYICVGALALASVAYFAASFTIIKDIDDMEKKWHVSRREKSNRSSDDHNANERNVSALVPEEPAMSMHKKPATPVESADKSAAKPYSPPVRAIFPPSVSEQQQDLESQLERSTPSQKSTPKNSKAREENLSAKTPKLSTKDVRQSAEQSKDESNESDETQSLAEDKTQRE